MTATLPERTLEAVQSVYRALSELGVDSALIGAVALAAHGFPRATRDVDLAVALSLPELRRGADALRARGFKVRISEPDAQDPLGGVLDIKAPGVDSIQIVNFDNPPASGHPAPPRSAIASARDTVQDIPVVDLPHLIAFKLYAGGRKSLGDILELLQRHPELDLEALGVLCTRLGLSRELAAALAQRDS